MAVELLSHRCFYPKFHPKSLPCFQRCSFSAFPAVPKCRRVVWMLGKSALGRMGQETSTEPAVLSSPPSPAHNSPAGMGGRNPRELEQQEPCKLWHLQAPGESRGAADESCHRKKTLFWSYNRWHSCGPDPLPKPRNTPARGWEPLTASFVGFNPFHLPLRPGGARIPWRFHHPGAAGPVAPPKAAG